MKKKLMTLLVGMLFVLSVVSCGNSDAMQGKWILTEAYEGENKVDDADLQKAGLGGTVFEFKAGKVNISTAASNEVSEGNYTVSGKDVTISSDGEDGEVKGTVDGDKFTIEDKNTSLKLVFKKK